MFRYPMDINQNYVKRVMGVPGDHLKVVDKELYLNGKRLVEPYARHIFPGLEPYRDNFPSRGRAALCMTALSRCWRSTLVDGELVVPPDSYFVMGDNRDDSLDSRYWGFVPRENIIGKPLLIFWSYDAPTEDLVDYTTNHFVDLAKNFFTKTRWNRELKLLRGYPVE